VTPGPSAACGVWHRPLRRARKHDIRDYQINLLIAELSLMSIPCCSL